MRAAIMGKYKLRSPFQVFPKLSRPIHTCLNCLINHCKNLEINVSHMTKKVIKLTNPN